MTSARYYTQPWPNVVFGLSVDYSKNRAGADYRHGVGLYCNYYAGETYLHVFWYVLLAPIWAPWTLFKWAALAVLIPVSYLLQACMIVSPFAAAYACFMSGLDQSGGLLPAVLCAAVGFALCGLLALFFLFDVLTIPLRRLFEIVEMLAIMLATAAVQGAQSYLVGGIVFSVDRELFGGQILGRIGGLEESEALSCVGWSSGSIGFVAGLAHFAAVVHRADCGFAHPVYLF